MSQLVFHKSNMTSEFHVFEAKKAPGKLFYSSILPASTTKFSLFFLFFSIMFLGTVVGLASKSLLYV